MNDRIKELLDASNVAVWDTNDYNGSPEFLGHEIDQEKFAELIIKECAIIANRAENSETETRCVFDIITDHFGVTW